MSNDEYQHQNNWEVLTEPVVVERDKDGKPLMSMQWILIDFSKKKDDKDNNNSI